MSIALRKVLVVQRRLTHYRVPFFEILREDLRAAGLELCLAHGTPTAEEASKRDGGELAWALRLPTRYGFGGRLCWQPFSHLSRDAALTVITAENKLLCNLGEQFGASGRRVALWGHGGNLQGDPGSLRERFKARVALRADWWFGYTDLSRGLLTQLGFPAERITVLDNAVDTSGLRAQFLAVQPEEQAALRARLQLEDGPVMLYLGSLYAEKRIDALLAAARALRERFPGFTLLVIGGGPDLEQVEAAAAGATWIKPLGVLRGEDKAIAASLACAHLHPGAAGLGVLDSFALGLPFLTMSDSLHGPEIAYVQDQHNGLVCRGSGVQFVDAVADVLASPAQLASMSANCVLDAQRYSVENMSRRFTEGVLGALAAPIRRGRA